MRERDENTPAKLMLFTSVIALPTPIISGISCESGTSEPATVSTQMPKSPVALNTEMRKSSNRACTRALFSLYDSMMIPA